MKTPVSVLPRNISTKGRLFRVSTTSVLPVVRFKSTACTWQKKNKWRRQQQLSCGNVWTSENIVTVIELMSVLCSFSGMPVKAVLLCEIRVNMWSQKSLLFLFPPRLSVYTEQQPVRRCAQWCLKTNTAGQPSEGYEWIFTIKRITSVIGFFSFDWYINNK